MFRFSDRRRTRREQELEAFLAGNFDKLRSTLPDVPNRADLILEFCSRLGSIGFAIRTHFPEFAYDNDCLTIKLLTAAGNGEGGMFDYCMGQIEAILSQRPATEVAQAGAVGALFDRPAEKADVYCRSLATIRARLTELGFPKEKSVYYSCAMIGAAFARRINNGQEIPIEDAMSHSSIALMTQGVIGVDMAAQMTNTRPFERATLLLPVFLCDLSTSWAAKWPTMAGERMGDAFHEATRIYNLLITPPIVDKFTSDVALRFRAWVLGDQQMMDVLTSRQATLVKLVASLSGSC